MSTEFYCPRCKMVVKNEENKSFPFCSKRCRLLDLGAWAQEGYRISRNIEERDLDNPEF